MSERAGSARGAKTKNTPWCVFCFFFLLRVRCVAFLRKTEVSLTSIGCNVFYRRPRVFLYKTYEYLHFSRKSRFFLKNSHKECRTQKMRGHVLRELHRFLERNKKHAEQNNRKKKKKKKKKKKNTHTHREQKKNGAKKTGAKKTTLTDSNLSP